ncbi:MAG: NADH-quinone oxidoreductase subunit L [Acidibrevibacterium sp.]|jgi:NADH-quinone oxidoreductase subunit L|uniref:NADH-quinone oxidoreductase subunit L n=1 Tax=Acidibrevibacterium fodinaquatile TaxID=1969806 RepID=UPI0023A89874|nr:NADH-quinone oxidoreductase subunit L [Acidibrevibacterium fodinaquatile]MCA7120169.1 NADH-quinone oxidoreductase subunit L [Acidibrevibacterium fodinaquatile]
MIYAIAVLAPLFGSAVAGLLGRVIGDKAAMAVTIACMVLATICGETAFVQLVWGWAPRGEVTLGEWLSAGSFHVSWALRYDTLSAVMVAMVTFVATLIHIYSVGYMAHEHKPVARFFSYLSFFSFAMLMLVTANNLLQLFFGWEGVGVASYLLIGYWYEKPSACAAAIKAFVVNRIGDLFFAVGIAMIFFLFGSISFSTIFAAVPQHINDTYALFGANDRAFEVIGILLFIGATGKSAQIGLHVWLPDAMEGPTPVSALIHAATMVTAGVFLMARVSPILEHAPVALGVITVVGGTTALFAATIGCVQNDIKRVIAYSTCSQLGYMFVAAGAGAYQVSIFHLITHAFFKALLFLSAGSVIHAMSDEQDMRRMGGLWTKIPLTYAVMWVGSLALAGIYPFAGYFSKDAILEAAFANGSPSAIYGFVCGVLAAFLTAFYSWRLLLMTFHGKSRADRDVVAHVHESPLVMTLPLVVLAIGALVAGFSLRDLFIGADWHEFWRGSIANAAGNHVLARLEDIPVWAALAPSVCAVLGIALAYYMYMFATDLPGRLAARFAPLYRFLLNKWYFDELYDLVFVRPAFAVARLLWQVGDATIIDGVPNGVATLAEDFSEQAVKLQTGSIAVYAFSMLVGVVLLIAIFLIFR